MKRMKYGLLLALTLLCFLVAGCQGEGLDLGSLLANISASTTGSVQMEELPYTLCVTGKGGWPISDTHITVYSDPLLSQRVTTIHTDSQGVASYTGKRGNTYYAVLDENVTGYETESCYMITDAYTEIQLEAKLVGGGYSVSPGDVMNEIDQEDWSGNQFVLSEVIKAGKPCIIWWVNSQSTDYDPQLARLKKVYETYGDKLEILLYTSSDCRATVRASTKRQPVTFPVISAGNSDPKWATGFCKVVAVDRYGMVTLMDDFANRVSEDGLMAIAEYLADENYRQKRVFNAVSELQDYMDYLKAGGDVTYRVKVTDASGNPMAGVRVDVSYAYRSFSVKTDEQGIASWPLYLRDDVYVKFNRNENNSQIYIMENEGRFEPGVTERTLILQEREKTTYTVRAVDPEGNPVRGVNIAILPYYDYKATDENGLVQWEGVIVDEPFRLRDGNISPIPSGYVLGPITREGDVFTILLYPKLTYKIKVVDENGNPLNQIWVEFYEEGGSEFCANGLTGTSGIANVGAKAGKFYVKLYRTVYEKGTWYEWRYGTFVLEEGVMEATFVVGEPEIVKLY